MSIKVKMPEKCRDCYWFDFDDENDYCGYDDIDWVWDERNVLEDVDGPIPWWCPLKKCYK